MNAIRTTSINVMAVIMMLMGALTTITTAHAQDHGCFSPRGALPAESMQVIEFVEPWSSEYFYAFFARQTDRLLAVAVNSTLNDQLTFSMNDGTKFSVVFTKSGFVVDASNTAIYLGMIRTAKVMTWLGEASIQWIYWSEGFLPMPDCYATAALNMIVGKINRP